MATRTSASHPLLIAEIATRQGGRVGLTLCPGKRQKGAISGDWDRDLGLDLDRVKAWGADVVVTLLENYELRELGVQTLPIEVQKRGIVWHHLPIEDYHAPDAAFEVGYGRVQDDLRSRLAAGGAVLVHCKGGLGRAGTVAARLLVEMGHAPDEAIAAVRAVRPGAIETAGQEAYVRALATPSKRSTSAAARAGAGARGSGRDAKARASSDWFERLTGFREMGYETTRAKLAAKDGRLHVEGRDTGFGIGALTLPSLGDLRREIGAVIPGGRTRLSIVEGDVRAMHALPVNEGALFQVASQFNMLEMVSPDVTPEAGVTGYQHDRTQGPACAMAAGAATIFRNYLVPVAGETGQTATRQMDGLADVGALFARRLGSATPPWAMRNGYALPSREQLEAIDAMLAGADEAFLDEARAALRVGLHRGVEVTDEAAEGRRVDQIFCSAVPVAYAGHPRKIWARFARLVLEAAYEATLLAAVLAAEDGGSNRVLLTRLGGGAFGNDDAWIDAAMARALEGVAAFDLDAVVVSYGPATPALRCFVEANDFAATTAPSARSGSARSRGLSPAALRALAAYAPIFHADDFSWGAWRREDGQMPWMETGAEATSFVEDAYQHGWVFTDFNWSQWAATDEARRLRDDAGAIAAASSADLGRLLTACIRSDRFCEGALAEAFNTGLLTRIVDRAAVLSRPRS